jgi:ribosomal protein L1
VCYCFKQVGHTKQSVVQIAENIMAVAECLSERYPGGWDNVRSLHIHLQDSPLIPVYITLSKSFK